MPLHAEQERVASVRVEAGVFALRYISSASETPPRVFVEASPAARSHVQIIFVPGKPVGLLEQPGQLALVVAERNGHLQLTVAATAGGGTSARVELEPLQKTEESLLEKSDAPADISEQQIAVPFDSALSLICHVAKRGDVTASEGDWICGPQAPSVIEGVRIDGSHFEYQALVQGSGGQWSPWVGGGQFVGTRGRGLALMGLRLRLTSSAPASARLKAEAAFLGCPLIKEEGRELELSTYAGADPLVGLRLQWDRHEPATEEIVVGEPTKEETPPLPAGTALKVFKSKRAGDRVLGLGG